LIGSLSKTSFVESKNGDRDSGARRETKVLGSPREQVVSLRNFESRRYFEYERYVWDEIGDFLLRKYNSG